MNDLEFVSSKDPYFKEQYEKYKKQNNDFAEHFLKTEKEYWENGGKYYAPEPID